MKANKYIEMTDTELDQQLAELKTELSIGHRPASESDDDPRNEAQHR